MKWEKLMKKSILTKVVLALIILGVSFWNIKQQQEALVLRETVSTLKKDHIVLEDKKRELLSENEQLSYQAKNTKNLLEKVQNEVSSPGSKLQLNSNYIDIVTKLFEANLNFTPENFEDKKQEVLQYLSDELKKKYFGQNRKTYQDSNGTSSQLKSLKIFPKESQDKELEGLIVVCYKNKTKFRDWVNGSSIFKVTYSTEFNEILEIINLGSVNPEVN